MRWISGIAIVLATPAMAANQFDLNCSGTDKSFEISITPGQSEKPYTAHYRVDLTSMKWCESACVVTHRFASVSETQLLLEDTKRNDGGIQIESNHFVDRTTGAEFGMSMMDAGMGRTSTYRTGTCTNSAFTGFPAVQTKF